MGLLHDGGLVGALHQLVDLRGHRSLDDGEQVLRLDRRLAALDDPDVQRAEAALVVRRDGHRVEDPLDVPVREPVLEQPLARGARDEALRARAGGHALGGDADEPPGAGLARDRRAEEGVDLLGPDAGDGRRAVLGVARRDRHLGTAGALPVADALGDVLGERLGAEAGLVEDDLADRLVDDLLEARHVRALLVRTQVDEALERRREQLFRPVLADPDDLLDPGDADPREREVQGRRLRLDVFEADCHGPVSLAGRRVVLALTLCRMAFVSRERRSRGSCWHFRPLH
ncbi:MAG: hypothetical protein AVDCRST_MAG30-1774 [uncultured Solirubrobacteraceae bacterium]|uniref:Uncharacterized protein n=1 Tax=uncultured Solirubrobacteraceae bacterium TaxID=1162706 RepID=A0A6J4SKK9_9ACTN|nr:MAG: hypothetical protein AVDCRST_MAG30-1774 [uncultured Solirubrobacteraceae bacterium]